MQIQPDFYALYQTYAGMVYNLCLHYLRQPEEAEEACQDVFVKVHAHLHRFRGQASHKTWIYRIAVHHCLDRLRRRKRRGLGFLRFFAPDQAPELPADDALHPGIALEDREALQKLLKQIDQLPENQKTALILKAIEGLSQKEIAAVMDISEKAVESLLSRAKANLKIKIENDEG